MTYQSNLVKNVLTQIFQGHTAGKIELAPFEKFWSSGKAGGGKCEQRSHNVSRKLYNFNGFCLWQHNALR
jgi:hypothetical protein